METGRGMKLPARQLNDSDAATLQISSNLDHLQWCRDAGLGQCEVQPPRSGDDVCVTRSGSTLPIAPGGEPVPAR
jgi:hypothetical protein